MSFRQGADAQYVRTVGEMWTKHPGQDFCHRDASSEEQELHSELGGARSVAVEMSPLGPGGFHPALTVGLSTHSSHELWLWR